MSRSGLAWPPAGARLQALPSVEAPGRLHRLSERPHPWWYASRPAETAVGTGRFDLPFPGGTCYLAAELEGALLEKTLRRPKKVVAAERLGELFHARMDVRSPVRLADLTAPAATGFGVNAEIHTTLDYAKPNAWAAALSRVRRKGLRYWLRADPALGLAGVALFGRAGLHRRAPAGMRTAVNRLDQARAVALLEAHGVTVVPIPGDVPTVPAP